MIVYLFYILLCIILAAQQCFTIEIIRVINKFFVNNNYHYYFLIITTLLILFVNFYICGLIIAAFIYYNGIFSTFRESLGFALDSFSTLGSSEVLPQPWGFLGPIIAIIGISTIAFITGNAFNIVTNDITNRSVFSRL